MPEVEGSTVRPVLIIQGKTTVHFYQRGSI